MGFKAFAKVVFRLGCLGFGGPAAVLSMIEEECCRKRQWFSHQRFSHLLAICKLFPGPVATQMVIAMGRIRHGVLGGVLAGLLFILPAFLIVLGLGAWYRHAAVSFVHAGLFWPGLQTGAIAVIVASVFQLARPYRQSKRAWVFGLVSAGLVAWRPQVEPIVIIGCGLLSYLGYRLARQDTAMSLALWGVLGLADEQARATAAQIFWSCFKAGAFVFGTGLAVVPVLEGDFVGRMGWLTHSQFMDGLAVGQVTPGPVTITATFLGYQVLGLSGALVATVGVFAAAFFNGVMVIPRIWDRLGATGTLGASAFISGAVPAVVGGVLGTACRLSAQTWNSVATGSAAGVLTGVFAASGVAIFWRRAPAWLVIPGAGGVAWVLERSLGPIGRVFLKIVHFTG